MRRRRTHVAVVAAIAAHVNLLQQEDVCVELCERGLDGVELVATFDVPLHDAQRARLVGVACSGNRLGAAIVEMHNVPWLGQSRVVDALLDELLLDIVCRRARGVGWEGCGAGRGECAGLRVTCKRPEHRGAAPQQEVLWRCRLGGPGEWGLCPAQGELRQRWQDPHPDPPGPRREVRRPEGSIP